MLEVNRIHIAQSLSDALEQLKSDNTRPLAAGTDLVPALRDGVLKDISLVDLHRVKEELSYIRHEQNVLRIGAMTTHTDIAINPLIRQYIPMLADSCRLVGSTQIRNRATIGGNIGNASPAADSVPVMVAADAQVVLQTSERTETMLLADFLVAPRRTKLPKGGLITEIIIPVPKDGWQGGYYKVGGRTALTIAIVSCAVLFDGKNDWRVAYGSMSPSIKRTPSIEQYIVGTKDVTREHMAEVVSASLSPIGDVRASAEYRLEVAANLAWQGWYEIRHS